MIKFLFSIFTSISILIVLFWFIPLERITDIPKQISPVGIFIGFCLYFITFILLALRWRLLLFAGQEIAGKRIPLVQLFAISAVHNFYSNFLPVKTGELAILYLARKYLQIDVSKSITSLLIARATDFTAIGLLVLLLIMVQNAHSSFNGRIIVVVAFVLIGAPVIAIMSMIIWGNRIAYWFNQRLANLLSGYHFHLGKRIVEVIAKTAQLFSETRQKNLYFKCFFLSIAIMIARVFIFSSFIVFGYEQISFFSAAFIGISALFITSTPLHGFLGLGTFEGGWVLGYVILGLSPKDGLLTAFNAHMLLIIFLAFLGATSNIFLMHFHFKGENVWKD